MKQSSAEDALHALQVNFPEYAAKTDLDALAEGLGHHSTPELQQSVAKLHRFTLFGLRAALVEMRDRGGETVDAGIEWIDAELKVG